MFLVDFVFGGFGEYSSYLFLWVLFLFVSNVYCSCLIWLVLFLFDLAGIVIVCLMGIVLFFLVIIYCVCFDVYYF